MDGYSLRSRSLISAQSALGFHPCALTSPLHQQDDPKASDLVLDGIRYLRTPAENGLRARAIRKRWPIIRELSVTSLLRNRILSVAKEQTFDVVHAHSPALCGLAAAQAARTMGVPFVYEIRAFWEDGAAGPDERGAKSLRYRLAKALETHVVRRADAVVAIAEAILGDLETRGISREKMFHVPNGVDSSRFQPRSRDTVLEKELGIEGVPTLGYLGTLFRWEGISWLVRAATALRQKGINFKLLLVGDGEEAPEVKKAIAEAGAESYVHFLGRVAHEEVEQYYSVMDVMVYPRRSMRLTEFVTPLKPLEVMALGKAVLGSAVGGIRELIDPQVTGILFEPESINDFCQKAGLLLGDPELRRQLGESARQKILAEKDWKALTRRYESVYEAAKRNARKRP